MQTRPLRKINLIIYEAMRARKLLMEEPSVIASVSWETLSTPCPSLSANRRLRIRTR